MQFHDALKRHEMLKDSYESWRGQRDEQDALEGSWAAATATIDNGVAMASAVRTTIPLSYIPLFRSFDAVPACYFIFCVSEALKEMNPTKTELHDTYYCSQLAQRAFALFEKRRQEADTMEEGFGCDRSAAWATLRKCDDRSQEPWLKDKMVKIAKLAGRMFQALKYEGMPKPSADPQMVTGISGGDDPTRLIDEEIAMLNVPGANAETLARLEDKQTMEYEMTGETLHGRGPVVMVIDESGSMHDNRQIWSKACAVAIARVALAEGRRVRVVHFSTTTVVRDLDPNDADSMRELAWSHLGGGTAIETALNVGIEQVKQLATEGAVGADIIFITDGIDNYSEAPFIEMKKEKIDLWTISIDCDLSKSQYGQKPFLASCATKYLHVDDKNLTTKEGVDVVGELREAALNNDTRAMLHAEDEEATSTTSTPHEDSETFGLGGMDFGNGSFGSN
jgi:hypothetical protein